MFMPCFSSRLNRDDIIVLAMCCKMMSDLGACCKQILIHVNVLNLLTAIPSPQPKRNYRPCHHQVHWDSACVGYAAPGMR